MLRQSRGNDQLMPDLTWVPLHKGETMLTNAWMTMHQRMDSPETQSRTKKTGQAKKLFLMIFYYENKKMCWPIINTRHRDFLWHRREQMGDTMTHTGTDTIRRCGLTRVGMSLLEEVCQCGADYALWHSSLPVTCRWSCRTPSSFPSTMSACTSPCPPWW